MPRLEAKSLFGDKLQDEIVACSHQSRILRGLVMNERNDEAWFDHCYICAKDDGHLVCCQTCSTVVHQNCYCFMNKTDATNFSELMSNDDDWRCITCKFQAPEIHLKHWYNAKDIEEDHRLQGMDVLTNTIERIDELSFAMQKCNGIEATIEFLINWASGRHLLEEEVTVLDSVYESLRNKPNSRSQSYVDGKIVLHCGAKLVIQGSSVFTFARTMGLSEAMKESFQSRCPYKKVGRKLQNNEFRLHIEKGYGITMPKRENTPNQLNYKVPDLRMNFEVDLYVMEMYLLFSNNADKLKPNSKEMLWLAEVNNGQQPTDVIMHRSHDRKDCNPYNLFFGRSSFNSRTKHSHFACKCTSKCEYSCLVSCGCRTCEKEQPTPFDYLDFRHNENDIHQFIVN
jgi:hypothetical protein